MDPGIKMGFIRDLAFQMHGGSSDRKFLSGYMGTRM